MSEQTKYRLLIINDVTTRQTRWFAREQEENSLVLNVGEGHARMRAEMQSLIQRGIRFQNAIFTGHGNKGVIFFGKEWIMRETWYTQFYNKGFDNLFLPNAMIYFTGCRVAGGSKGWGFLEAAARSLTGLNGGTAQAWTSLGFYTPFRNHVSHVWGDTRQVTVLPRQDGLLFYENWKLIQKDGYPVRPT